jgi:hypothetical protein
MDPQNPFKEGTALWWLRNKFKHVSIYTTHTEVIVDVYNDINEIEVSVTAANLDEVVEKLKEVYR